MASYYGKQRAFSVLELCVVMVVISIIIYLGSSVYDQPISKSQIETIRFQAKTFSRSVNNLHAQRILRNSDYVVLKGQSIYFNEKGWPANTSRSMSPKSDTQTPEECQQLWQALYELAPTSDINISDKNNRASFNILSINGRICRYELMRKQEGEYFFDYHLGTGEVIVRYPG